ncbi:unnamed protein product [Leptidea sinapis]|uniref:EH domain-containing protein n=1 Tax=Leptidea sinapis TaxID=189913 RepID=A0A5E4QLV0_9NEOP|nr:unnamed protein product [Leptidea sinapis]
MAALPSPTQVAGIHGSIYEAYYHQVDPNGSGAIQALDAARFLKKSRLSDVAGLFVALKLVALAQAGRELSMALVHADVAPPALVTAAPLVLGLVQ